MIARGRNKRGKDTRLHWQAVSKIKNNSEILLDIHKGYRQYDTALLSPFAEASGFIAFRRDKSPW